MIRLKVEVIMGKRTCTGGGMAGLRVFLKVGFDPETYRERSTGWVV